MSKKSKVITGSSIIFVLLISVLLVVLETCGGCFQGSEKGKIRIDIIAIILSIISGLMIFLLTYSLIDSRQVKKGINSENTAKLLISNSCKECLDNISIFNYKEVVKKYMIPKMDFNSAYDDKITINLTTLPFRTLDEIVQISANGNIEKAILKKYLDIKKRYISLIKLLITFYDIDDNQNTDDQIALGIHIKNEKENITNDLNNLIHDMEK